MNMEPPWSFKPPLASTIRRSQKELVLREWRGVDLVPEEIAWQIKARTPEQLMPQVLRHIRLDRRRNEAEIVHVWNNIVNPKVAAHAQPTGLVKGTLFVTVDSSVWMDEIMRFHRHDILKRLQTTFGSETVAKISFRCA